MRIECQSHVESKIKDDLHTNQKEAAEVTTGGKKGISRLGVKND